MCVWGGGSVMFVSVCETTVSVGMVGAAGDLEDKIEKQRHEEKQSKSKTCFFNKGAL